MPVRRRVLALLGCTVVVVALTLALWPNRSLSLQQGSAGWRSIAAGKTVTYHLPLVAGQFARVAVEQRDIDLQLSAHAPDGREIARINASSFGKEVLAVVAIGAGEYRVNVVAGKDTRRGFFRIELTDLRPATPEDRYAIEAQNLFQHATQNQTGTPDVVADLSQVVQLWRDAGDPYQHARALNRLGEDAHRRAKYELANRSYEEALGIWRSLGSQAELVLTEINWFNLSGPLGEKRGNKEDFQRHVETWRKLGDRRGEGQVLRRMGNHLRDPRESPNYWDRAMRLFHDLGDVTSEREVLQNLVTYHTGKHDWRTALPLAQRSLQIAHLFGNQRDIAASKSHLAYVLEEAKRYEEALQLHEEALTMRRRQNDPTAEISILQAIAIIDTKLGRLKEARAAAEQASRRQEALAGSLASEWWKSGARSHTDSISFLLTVILAQHEASPTEGFDVEAFQLLDRNRTRYLGLATETDCCGQEAGTLVLAYAALPDKTMLWTLDQDGLKSHTIKVARNRMQELTRRFHASVSQSGKTIDFETARSLSQLLLEPVMNRLGGKRVAVVWDENLGVLPFAALPDPNHPKGEPLIAQHEIAYLPSVGTISPIRNRRAAKTRLCESVAILVDPVFHRADERWKASRAAPSVLAPDLLAATRSAGIYHESNGIPRLPFAELELENIRAIVPEYSRKELVGFAATRDAALEELRARHCVAHVSTHGFVHPEKPELSGMVFSLYHPDGRPRPGFLRLPDIKDTTIRTQLVVLAACETAVGHARAGEAAVGLTPTLLRAGAPRVVSTLWKVDDEAMARLMAEFYRSLWLKRKPPGEALRLAQNHLRATKKWASPYYWSGVVLYGDWSPL